MTKINWRIRLQNKAFWVAIIPALIVALQAVGDVFGLTIDLGQTGDKLLEVVNALFVVLAILGIVVDPTTTGLSDSTKALGYDKPNDK